MISRNLETGDSYGVNHNGRGKILIQLTSNQYEEHVRNVFTPKEAREFIDEIETDLKIIEGPDAPSWPSLKVRVIEAEQKLKELQARMDYAMGFGLIIGVAKSSDCPEGKLAHTASEGSELDRLYGGIADFIDAENKLQKINELARDLGGSVGADIRDLSFQDWEACECGYPDSTECKKNQDINGVHLRKMGGE